METSLIAATAPIAERAFASGTGRYLILSILDELNS